MVPMVGVAAGQIDFSPIPAAQHTAAHICIAISLDISLEIVDNIRQIVLSFVSGRDHIEHKI